MIDMNIQQEIKEELEEEIEFLNSAIEKSKRKNRDSYKYEKDLVKSKEELNFHNLGTAIKSRIALLNRRIRVGNDKRNKYLLSNLEINKANLKTLELSSGGTTPIRFFPMSHNVKGCPTRSGVSQSRPYLMQVM